MSKLFYKDNRSFWLELYTKTPEIINNDEDFIINQPNLYLTDYPEVYKLYDSLSWDLSSLLTNLPTKYLDELLESLETKEMKDKYPTYNNSSIYLLASKNLNVTLNILKKYKDKPWNFNILTETVLSKLNSDEKNVKDVYTMFNESNNNKYLKWNWYKIFYELGNVFPVDPLFVENNIKRIDKRIIPRISNSFIRFNDDTFCYETRYKNIQQDEFCFITLFRQ